MRFQCSYVEADGSSAQAVLDAKDEQELHDNLHDRGQLLLSAIPIDAPVAADEPGTSVRAAGRHRVAPKNLLAFTQAMETSLAAGVPVLTTLDAVVQQEANARDRRTYEDIAKSVEQGEPLADSLLLYPRTFDRFYVSLVRSGEESGSLAEAFGSLASFIEWREDIKATARQAAIYPCIVLSAAYGLILFLLTFVLPRLTGLLAKVSDQLPWTSLMLMRLSNTVADNVWMVLGATVLAVLTLAMFARTDAGRIAFVSFLSRVPAFSAIVTKLNLAQACRNLGVLSSSGLPILNALELTADSLTLARLRDGLLRVRDRVMEGGSLAGACADEEVLPPLALSMLRVGEDSGGLPVSFERLANKYDREAKDAVKKAVALLEPAMTVFLGVIVGGIAAIVITTLYTAVGGLAK